MGGAVSTGEDNDELVDNLVEADYIKSPHIERVFRAVDRAEYYLEDHRDNAYKDLAWKHGNIHLSAPCIYSEVMESLKLGSGMSFLNLGSGTGYLSTLAGLILGPYGVNHGVEHHTDVVDYAKERLVSFKKKCESFDEFEFCEPHFIVGNCLLLNSDCRLYDRVYCGAACPVEHENYMKNLIRVGGILVMPLNDQLLQITRSGETTWETKSVLPVSFATLVVPDKRNGVDMVDLPEFRVLSLQEICRCGIRVILRANIKMDHPNLSQHNRKKVKRPPRRSGRGHVNVMPRNMEMMILGQLAESEDEERTAGNGRRIEASEEEEEDEVPDLRRRRRIESDEDEAEELNRVRRRAIRIEEEDDDDDDDEDSMPEILRQMAAMQRRFMEIARRDREERQDRVQDDQGIEEDINEADLEEENGEAVSGVRPRIFLRKSKTDEAIDNGMMDKLEEEAACKPEERSLSTSSSDEMEVDMSETSNISCAIPISPTNGRQRCSSSNSISTSYTSGIGTCSSVEEPVEMDFIKELVDEEEEINSNVQLLSNGKSNSQSCHANGKFGDATDKDSNSGAEGTAHRVDNNVESDEHQRSPYRDPPPYLLYIPPHTTRVEEDQVEEDDCEPSKPQITFSSCMQNRVEKLPIPLALKQFLLFYRTESN